MKPFNAVQARSKSVQLISGFVGVEPQFCDPLKAKPKLAGKKWLGEKCLNEKQKLKFRKELEAVWEQYCDPKIVKKILRGGDTQINESLHSIQCRMYRKDMPHGDYSSYVFAMAASVLKMSLGPAYVIQLTKKLGLLCPISGNKTCAKRAKMLGKSRTYKTSAIGKKRKASNQSSLDARLHCTTDKIDEGEYLGKGKGLVAKL